MTGVNQKTVCKERLSLVHGYGSEAGIVQDQAKGEFTRVGKYRTPTVWYVIQNAGVIRNLILSFPAGIDTSVPNTLQC
jgi:hypothetical protein